MSSVNDSEISFIFGRENFKLFITASSLATPSTLKQSPLLGVISNLIIESLPVILDLTSSYPSTSRPAMVS